MPRSHPCTTAVRSWCAYACRPGYDTDWLPLLGELTSIDLGWNPGATDVSDVRYNQATGSAVVLGGVDTRDAYSFESVVGEDAVTRRDPTRDPSADQRQPAGAFLDDLLGPFDRDELLPLERVLLLARYLRSSGTALKGSRPRRRRTTWARGCSAPAGWPARRSSTAPSWRSERHGWVSRPAW